MDFRTREGVRRIGDPPIASYTIADGVAIVGIVQASDMRPEWQKLHPCLAIGAYARVTPVPSANFSL